ncbi:MAG: ATP-grasp domain-containing protein [Nitrospinota bacterium]|nr:MAG: ATP-grasp domain-containing protein [Nitrospinota bacterium]
MKECPSMSRLLLLMTTTTYKARAFIEAAQRLDLPVTIGSEQPQILAAANPAAHLTLNFLEPEEATRQIVAFAQTHPLQAIVAADDDGVILAAMAAKALGLVHNPVEAVLAARNKYQMRKVLAEAGLPSPRFTCLSIHTDPQAVAEGIPFPCVVKPLALSASRGVIRADTPAQFVAAFHRVVHLLQQPEPAGAERRFATQILVEDFIPGQEVALEGLLSHGQLRVLALFDKPDPLEGPFFEETIYVTPSRFPPALQEAIQSCTQQAITALGLREGPIHAELRVNDNGPWVLEIAPRSIGGLCSRTLRFTDGISLEEVILRQAMGFDITGIRREERAAGVMMIPIPQAGILREIHGQSDAEHVPGIEEIRLTIPPGQVVIPPPEGSRYLGFIFARGDTPEEVETALRAAHQRLTFTIDPLPPSAPPLSESPPLPTPA